MGLGPRVGGVRSPARLVRSLAAIVVLLSATVSLAPRDSSAESWAAPRTVFVPTTGHTSDGLFLDAWRADRALLGDPVTEEIQPRAGFVNAGGADVVQFYEHLAIVYLPDEPAGEQVKALDLGRQALEQAQEGSPSLALERAIERTVCPPGTVDECLTVVATGHTVRGPFLTFWNEGTAADWLGLPLTEAFRAPDGTRVQYFENGILRLALDGTLSPLPLGRIAARQAQVSTEPVDQPPDVPTYKEELFIPPPEATPTETEADATDWSLGPGPQQGAWKEIVVSISSQKMWAYEGGELVVSSLVSTGTADVPETVTPVGHWSVLAKFDVQDMEGTISDEYYFVEDVPYVMYFDNLGNAIHGTYWHNNFGAPMSHGCVNLPLDIAAWMYEWAPVGTAVSVVA